MKGGRKKKSKSPPHIKRNSHKYIHSQIPNEAIYKSCDTIPKHAYSVIQCDQERKGKIKGPNHPRKGPNHSSRGRKKKASVLRERGKKRKKK
jgi:hypothetical protein